GPSASGSSWPRRRSRTTYPACCRSSGSNDAPRRPSSPASTLGRARMVDVRALVPAVVEAAIRAPSVHNTQPWRFVAHDDVVELWDDPARGLPVLDPVGRDRLISCGA